MDSLPETRIENSAATAPHADASDPMTAAAAAAVSATAAVDTPATESGSAALGNSTPSISYSAARVIGNGSFGVVFQATVRETGETVAIKKVLQDKRYKNRELQIMRMLDHTNIVKLKHCFYSSGEKQDEVYLNLVLEYVPETVYRISRHYSKVTASIPSIFIKLYTYQMLRALAYLHSMGVTHRDLKPQNLLLDPATQVMKLCDFGSAKALVKGEPNISYICSRYYRAPELIFGATDYLPAIDVWSTGCVMAELMLGQPLFPGESGVDQLVEIIKVLGTPSKAEILSMNQNYSEFRFPAIRPHPWNKVFKSRTTPDAIDLVSQMLSYNPAKRLKPMEGLSHPFFDELRVDTCRLPNGKGLPPLFDFDEREFKQAGELAKKILPSAVFDDLCQKYGQPTANPRDGQAQAGAGTEKSDGTPSPQGAGGNDANADSRIGTGGGHGSGDVARLSGSVNAAGVKAGGNTGKE